MNSTASAGYLATNSGRSLLADTTAWSWGKGREVRRKQAPHFVVPHEAKDVLPGRRERGDLVYHDEGLDVGVLVCLGHQETNTALD